MGFLLTTLSAKSTGYVTTIAEIRERMLPALASKGWQLLGAYRPVIGDLTKIYEVWRIPADADGAAGDDDGLGEFLRELEPVLLREEVEAITALPFSPPPDEPGRLELPDGHDGPRTYLFVKITAKSTAQVEQVADLVSRSVPIIRNLGWELVGSYRPVIGNLTSVYDVWEVESASAVTDSLAKLPGHPDLVDIRQNMIPNNVAHEVTQVVRKTPYSP